MCWIHPQFKNSSKVAADENRPSFLYGSLLTDTVLVLFMGIATQFCSTFQCPCSWVILTDSRCGPAWPSESSLVFFPGKCGANLNEISDVPLFQTLHSCRFTHFQCPTCSPERGFSVQSLMYRPV